VQKREAADTRIAYPGTETCRVILVDEKIMRARGWWREIMLRHETGTATLKRLTIQASGRRRQMSTVPITTEGRVFVAQMIRDVGARDTTLSGACIGRWVIVNYDILARNAEHLHGIPWSGVILDQAHFIKNNSQRTSH
jgi:hypothetical protein